MAESKKPRGVASTPAAAKSESKATAEFRRFKEARAAASIEGSLPQASRQPSAPPPSFSLPPAAQSWAALPQPGIVQPAPLAVGSIGDRLGSTMRLGIDVVNMTLASTLRLLGGIGYGGTEHGCGCSHGYGASGGYGHHAVTEHQGGCNCCEIFEHDDCCTPSVGNCYR